jgi:4a-hydroxytetrahydrobiopterin dehydratase
MAASHVEEDDCMSPLAAERCVDCRPDSPRVTPAEAEALRREIPQWRIVEREGVARLERVFSFANFVEALTFTDRIGALAEEAGHHPAITTEWGRVTVGWWTHAIAGLHRNDFVMAAKTDERYAGR